LQFQVQILNLDHTAKNAAEEVRSAQGHKSAGFLVAVKAVFATSLARKDVVVRQE
jgi:hypothetical protein